MSLTPDTRLGPYEILPAIGVARAGRLPVVVRPLPLPFSVVPTWKMPR